MVSGTRCISVSGIVIVIRISKGLGLVGVGVVVKENNIFFSSIRTVFKMSKELSLSNIYCLFTFRQETSSDTLEVLVVVNNTVYKSSLSNMFYLDVVDKIAPAPAAHCFFEKQYEQLSTTTALKVSLHNELCTIVLCTS
jgi:hypothetical protein